MSDFARRLKEELERNNMGPAELSRKINVGRPLISNYMSGYCKPNAHHIHLIAQTLGVSESWLLGYDENTLSINKRCYIAKISLKEMALKVNIPAVSMDEAIGILVKLIPTVTYKNIIEIKEDT